MSSTMLIHFDVETEEEINTELVSRKIELMNVVNVETHYESHKGEEGKWITKKKLLRVWYWHISNLIT